MSEISEAMSLLNAAWRVRSTSITSMANFYSLCETHVPSLIRAVQDTSLDALAADAESQRNYDELTSLRSENERLRDVLSDLDYFVVVGDDPITCVAGYFFESDANAHAMRLIGAKSPRVMERDEWLARQAVAGGGE